MSLPFLKGKHQIRTNQTRYRRPLEECISSLVMFIAPRYPLIKLYFQKYVQASITNNPSNSHKLQVHNKSLLKRSPKKDTQPHVIWLLKARNGCDNIQMALISRQNGPNRIKQPSHSTYSKTNTFFFLQRVVTKVGFESKNLAI